MSAMLLWCPVGVVALFAVDEPIKHAARFVVGRRDPQSILPNFAHINRCAPRGSASKFNIPVLDAVVPFHAVVVPPAPPCSNAVVLATAEHNADHKAVGVEPKVVPGDDAFVDVRFGDVHALMAENLVLSDSQRIRAAVAAEPRTGVLDDP